MILKQWQNFLEERISKLKFLICIRPLMMFQHLLVDTWDSSRKLRNFPKSGPGLVQLSQAEFKVYIAMLKVEAYEVMHSSNWSVS